MTKTTGITCNDCTTSIASTITDTKKDPTTLIAVITTSIKDAIITDISTPVTDTKKKKRKKKKGRKKDRKKNTHQ